MLRVSAGGACGECSLGFETKTSFGGDSSGTTASGCDRERERDLERDLRCGIILGTWRYWLEVEGMVTNMLGDVVVVV